MTTRDPEDPRSDEDMQAEEAATRQWREVRPTKNVLNGDWQSLPPTAKQLRFLTKHGHTPLPTTRGDAALVINDIIRRTPRQDPPRSHLDDYADSLLGKKR